MSAITRTLRDARAAYTTARLLAEAVLIPGTLVLIMFAAAVLS